MTDEITTNGGPQESVSASAPVKPDEDEAEAEAVMAIIRALKSLSPDARRRIVTWTAAKYGTNAGESGVAGADVDRSRSTASSASFPAASVDPESFGDFAAMFDAAQPASDVERVLTACYWVQFRAGKNPFGTQDANTLLKNLGHQIDRIGDVFDLVRQRKPLPIIQLKKDGSRQQSRKLYRMTPAGIKLVVDALRDGGFPAPDPS